MLPPIGLKICLVMSPGSQWERSRRSIRRDTGGTKNWNVVIEEAQEGALAKYADELKAKDWKIMSTTTAGSGGSVMATKKDLMAVVVFQTDKKAGAITISQK